MLVNTKNTQYVDRSKTTRNGVGGVTSGAGADYKVLKLLLEFFLDFRMCDVSQQTDHFLR